MRTIEDVAEEKLSQAPYISFVTKSTFEEEQVQLRQNKLKRMITENINSTCKKAAICSFDQQLTDGNEERDVIHSSRK